ncbi:hypothetical protein AGDE_01717 [Angomonas deanei]|uniref:Uncharacterized protein n=1 Tax=Angomonas deanei TaxID=59799 RepID=S9WN47_9TRYP|nr:hypothetical protein AGDE_11410 [Angomonas deanei]EPY37400.1 hypothetical protein AGDE_06534 [Angomonas deanei]EPY42206.1 hypothetical protein AGDE_01717 [Angomonas deanei]CAD2218110.1 hypothetical protein, conserved [Angomonas deanei]|eukprot:EPY26352.1 hypothetical protein AGDE_11410 [Angomonas deanei]
MNTKKYIGRQLRPSQLAAELLPRDERWCTVCHQSVLVTNLAAHNRSLQHRLGHKKMNKLKNLSLSMWEQHRGAPMEEESRNDASVEMEFQKYRQDQKRREQAQLRDKWYASKLK